MNEQTIQTLIAAQIKNTREMREEVMEARRLLAVLKGLDTKFADVQQKMDATLDVFADLCKILRELKHG